MYRQWNSRLLLFDFLVENDNERSLFTATTPDPLNTAFIHVSKTNLFQNSSNLHNLFSYKLGGWCP